MSANDKKRYYWAKITERFFDDHKIRMIQEEEHGNEAVLLYIFMIAESASHGGLLRCDETTPYTPFQVGSLCRLPKESREPAFELLRSFNLVSILDDGTIKLAEYENFVGSETNNAVRQREFRSSKNADRSKCVTDWSQTGHKRVTAALQKTQNVTIDNRDKRIDNRDKNNNIIIPQTPFLKKNTPQNITTEVNHDDDDDDACPSLTHDNVQSNGYMSLKFPREKIAKLVLGIACASSKFKKEYAEPFTDYVFSTSKLEAASGNPRAYLVRIFNDWLSSGLFDKDLHRITRDEFSLVIQDLNKSRDSKIDKQMESECWDWVVSQESDSYGHEISKYSVKSLITNFMAKRTARRNDEKSRREEQEAQEVANKALDEQRIAYGLTYEIEEV